MAFERIGEQPKALLQWQRFVDYVHATKDAPPSHQGLGFIVKCVGFSRVRGEDLEVEI